MKAEASLVQLYYVSDSYLSKLTFDGDHKQGQKLWTLGRVPGKSCDQSLCYPVNISTAALDTC